MATYEEKYNELKDLLIKASNALFRGIGKIEAGPDDTGTYRMQSKPVAETMSYRDWVKNNPDKAKH